MCVSMVPINPVIFFVSFVSCLVVTKYLIRKFKKKGIVAKDMYKKDRPEVADMGGLGMLFGILSGLIVAQLLIQDVTNLLVFYFVVMVFAIFTLTDDLINIGRKPKVFVPFILALPIALLNMDTTLSFYFFQVDMGIWFPYLIAPLYLMVVANLVNMHSGYNGLQTGLSGILLITITAKVIMKFGWGTAHFLMPVLGAVLAFWYFDHYPSKAFPGNVGSFIMGSAIGGLLILNNMEFFGVVILIPHIINFLISRYSRMFKRPDKEHIFAKLREDGTIEPPKYYTLKWIPSFWFRLTEKQSVWVMYAFTIVFCLLGIFFF